MAIIRSLLDTDLYKLTMQQAVLHLFPGAWVKYKFKCRNEKADLHDILTALHAEIQHIADNVRLTDKEADYLQTIRFLKKDYIDFLRSFRFNDKYIKIRTIFEPPGGLEIEIEGPWLQTILWEVPLLSVINQLYYTYEDDQENRFKIISALPEVLRDKIQVLQRDKMAENLPVINFSEFGTRRRFSYAWQNVVIDTLLKAKVGMIGTSNVHFAQMYGITPMGTMAHEFLQAGQALGPNLRNSQKFALDSWVQEYRGDLGIALTDVIGMDAFLQDFDLFFCKLYDGVRHDSGDPFLWAEKMIAHYKKMGIDPQTKTFVFSDGLTFPLCVELESQFGHRAKLLFGIGTYLTNDAGPKHKRLDIVIKMVECNGQSVAKLSDSPGKIMCQDKEYLAYLTKVFQHK